MLKYDTPNNKPYERLLTALQELTGLQWGYHRAKVQITYVSCPEIAVKIGLRKIRGVDYVCKTAQYKDELSEALLKFELTPELRQKVESHRSNTDQLGSNITGELIPVDPLEPADPDRTLGYAIEELNYSSPIMTIEDLI